MTAVSQTQWMPAWGVAALSFAVFLPFAWAIRGHFLQRGRLPAGMMLLSVASLLTYACMVLVLGLRDHAPPPWHSMAALVMMMLASALFWWAIATTRAHRLNLAHSGESSGHIQSSGPYGWIRHPFYTAYMLFWVGTAVLAGGWQWLPALALVAWYVLVARREEGQFERSGLADGYADYRNRTGMLVPMPWRRKC